jgi:tetratricopeptide (TPR) repeat protein
VNAGTGDELAAYHTTIDGPKELIPALDKLTRDLRGKIGESLKDVRAAPPLEQVTTSSLEALRKYVDGARANDIESDPQKAILLLRDAVALDTTFAMAYRKLGVALSNARMPRDQVNAALAHAYRYRDRLSGRERDLTIGSYFDNGPGRDRQKAAAAYRAMLARDSLDPVALVDLSSVLNDTRDFVHADSLLRVVLATEQPPSATAAQNLEITQVAAGMLVAAESTARMIREQFRPKNAPPAWDAPLQYAEGKVDSATATLVRVRAADPRPDNRALATLVLSQLAMQHGRLSESRELAADHVARNRALGIPPPPLEGPMDSAWIDIWFLDQPARGVRTLDAAIARTPLKMISDVERPDFKLATLYAVGGRPDRARAILAQYAADVRDSSLVRISEPRRHDALANIAIAEHRPADAITEFRLGDQLPDGPASPCTQCLSINLGRAFDAADMPDSAIASYERYIATPNFGKAETDARYLAGVHKRLGELYEAKGNREKAAAQYLAFADLWKNADPELQPAVAAAKQRLAQLQDAERRHTVR